MAIPRSRLIPFSLVPTDDRATSRTSPLSASQHVPAAPKRLRGPSTAGKAKEHSAEPSVSDRRLRNVVVPSIIYEELSHSDAGVSADVQSIASGSSASFKTASTSRAASLFRFGSSRSRSSTEQIDLRDELTVATWQSEVASRVALKHLPASHESGKSLIKPYIDDTPFLLMDDEESLTGSSDPPTPPASPLRVSVHPGPGDKRESICDIDYEGNLEAKSIDEHALFWSESESPSAAEIDSAVQSARMSGSAAHKDREADYLSVKELERIIDILEIERSATTVGEANRHSYSSSIERAIEAAQDELAACHQRIDRSEVPSY